MSGDNMVRDSATWPELPYAPWRPTRDTLHMYTQVLGKLRLALCPFEPGWGNVALYVTPRGLTTSSIPLGTRSFDAELDLHDHMLVLRSSDGLVERRDLGAPVADFYADVVDALARMRIDVAISMLPSEVADPIPFVDDREHHTYDRSQVTRFHRVLSLVDMVMNEHRAAFAGRTTPVQFFWGSFDIALTRFSGRAAPVPPSAGVIARYAMGAEAIAAGWWPGDERLPFPAFYAYAHPAPTGLEQVPLQPDGAAWSAEAGEFLYRYETARATPDPRASILEFLRSTYAGAAVLGGWSSALTDVSGPAASGMSLRAHSAEERS